MYDGMTVYRALVVSSSSSTGDVRVRIPSVLGASNDVSISKIGRTEVHPGVWNVPNVGDQILVAVEDDRFSNVFIVEANPSTIDAALLTGTVNSARLTGAYTGITGLGTIAGTLTAGSFSGSGASLTSIPNSATTATNANTASAIVARDGSGNFTAGTITAALSGNATTATTLGTARNINGVSFDGSANITVPAAAGTLTGTTLASGVTASSLTSVGTLTGLTVSGALSAGSLDVTGLTSVQSLTIKRGDTVAEGGQIDWQSANGTYPGWMNDVFQGNMRWWNATTGVVMNVSTAGVLTVTSSAVISGNHLQVTGISPTLVLTSTDAERSGMIHVNGNLMYFLGGAQNAGMSGWDQNGTGQWPLILNLTNNLATFGGGVTSVGILIGSKPMTATSGTASNWENTQVRAQSVEAGGTNSAGFTAWVPAAAPMFRVYQGSGEVWNCLNSPNNDFIPIWAKAFTVQSTLRSKKDIATISDEELLTRLAETPRVVRYRYKVAPQSLTPTERFADVDARWQASGHPPLTPQPRHFQSQDHDCVTMNCAGNADSPCPITVNSEPDIGVIAEEWDEVWPEVVWVDKDGEVGGVDYSRIGPVALRAAALLLGQVEELTARVAALETPL